MPQGHRTAKCFATTALVLRQCLSFVFCLARFSFARPRLCSRVVCLSVFPFPLLTHIHDTWHGRAGTCLFLLDFFGASTLAFLRISSSVELCLPYPELRFLVFCRIQFCMDGSYGFRTRKNFSVALFLVVSGRLVSGPVFLSISGISIFVFLSGINFKLDVSGKICSRKILRSFDAWFFGLLVICAAVVLRYPDF